MKVIKLLKPQIRFEGDTVIIGGVPATGKSWRERLEL
jgi:GTP1/Obg family GTP-binding protein